MKQTNPMDPRMQERRLRTAFLSLVKYLPSRPEPRHIFDNVARASNPLPPKGSDVAEVYRNVMASAIATNDHETIERTQFMIISFHDELLAYGLANSPLLSNVAFEDTACHAMEETAAALSGIGKAGTMRTDGAVEEAVREAGEAIVSLEVFRESVARMPRRNHLSLAHR
jgi:hypothetical protein